MRKGDTFNFQGESWICRESYKNGLYLAQAIGTDDMKYFHRVNGALDYFCVKFTQENVDVGTSLTPVFNLGRFTVLSINDGKATISVCYPTPDGRTMERKFKLTFSTFLKKANSAFFITPTEEDLPADGRFLRPSNDPNWKFKITKDYGNGDVLVEIFYCEERIDTKRMNRITLAGYMNTPFEFGEPEMKGKEKMAHETSTDYESDLNVANSVLFYTTDELITGKTVVYSDGQKKVKIVAEPRDYLKRIVRFGDEEDSREINSRVLCAMINFRKEDVRENDVCKNLCVYKRNNPSEIYVVTSYDRDARKVNVNVLSSTNGSYIRQIVSVPIADFLSEVNDKFPAHSDVIKRLIDCRKEIEDIVKNCKNPLDRLLDNDIPWGKQVEALTPNLPKGCSLKAKIVKTRFVEESKHGLHKD